jgi:transcriptional regulator with XRE-family HTH domain
MKLKSVREAAEKTQQQVAADAGVDPAVVSRLERARKPPRSYVSVMRIAHALHVHPLEICPVPGLEPDLAKAVNS